MATYHVVGKPNPTILDSNSRIVQVTKNVFSAMFVFQRGSLHISKDVSYVENNFVLSFVYQVPDVNFEGMFWIITNGRYQIVSKHSLNNFWDIVLTSDIVISMENIVAKGVVMKENPNIF